MKKCLSKHRHSEVNAGSRSSRLLKSITLNHIKHLPSSFQSSFFWRANPWQMSLPILALLLLLPVAVSFRAMSSSLSCLISLRFKEQSLMWRISRGMRRSHTSSPVKPSPSAHTTTPTHPWGLIEILPGYNRGSES